MFNDQNCRTTTTVLIILDISSTAQLYPSTSFHWSNSDSTGGDWRKQCNQCCLGWHWRETLSFAQYHEHTNERHGEKCNMAHWITGIEDQEAGG
eukprot:757067-Hanusia_phi.AAC.4